MKIRRAIVKEMVWKYQGSGKKEKGKILEELINLTGYNRRFGDMEAGF